MILLLDNRQTMNDRKQQIVDSVNEYRLNQFLEKCCRGINTDADEVIRGLLTSQNIKDIASGAIKSRTVKAHIHAWVKGGKKKIN